MTLEEFLTKVIRNYEDWDEEVELFYDYLCPGNGVVGKTYEVPNSDLQIKVVDEYYRRIEDEEVWVVLSDTMGRFYKVYGEFTSWDSVTYDFKETSMQPVETYQWV